MRWFPSLARPRLEACYRRASVQPARYIWGRGRVAGQPGYVTTDMPSSTLIAGAWPELLLGLWGPGIELVVNPHEPTAFTKGIVQVRCLVSCDGAVAHAAAFNAATSVR